MQPFRVFANLSVQQHVLTINHHGLSFSCCTQRQHVSSKPTRYCEDLYLLSEVWPELLLRVALLKSPSCAEPSAPTESGYLNSSSVIYSKPPMSKMWFMAPAPLMANQNFGWAALRIASKQTMIASGAAGKTRLALRTLGTTSEVLEHFIPVRRLNCSQLADFSAATHGR